jgi:hypothetical protein
MKRLTRRLTGQNELLRALAYFPLHSLVIECNFVTTS